MPNQIVGDLLHTMAYYGLSRVRTELYNLLVIPFLAPHPEQTAGESPRHGYLGDPGIPPHRQVCILPSPLRIATYGSLCCFHQQETQQSVPLLTDMSQPLTIGTGVFTGNQPQVAANLLAASKTLRRSDDQHKGEGSEGTNPRMRHQP